MQRPVRILVVAALAALLAGCAADPAAEPTPTPSFSSEAEAFAAAEATYRAYVDALNQVDLADPETFEAVYAWTTGDANAGIRETLSQMHADSWTVTGHSVPALIQRLQVASEGVELAVCLDVSAVQVLDRNQTSVVSGTRGDVQTMMVLAVPNTRSPTGVAIAAITGRSAGPKC
ncbi:MAG: hypothetical protein Q7T17_09215 [Microbacterium sp.]|uniref:hypothetical protein n=1 Tax=Microbacterium sp. TaxID=51671 RepID=UPI0027165ECB|nr:hypothetical protein [Microbacterium sp.]MDO8383144.1 hypothetical protein [Microbacterium sp.]